MKIIKCKKPLSLKNEGKLEIMFIGTGTAFGKDLFNNNFIIVKGDTHLMVDLGMTGPIALKSVAGLDVSDIENVFITHSHADHIGGIEYLALFHRYVTNRLSDKNKLKMIISEEYQEILWNLSLRGGMEWNETSSSGEKLVFEDYFEPIRPKVVSNSPRTTLEIDFEGIHLEIFGTNHIPENAKTQQQAFTTYGLFIDNRLMISGDTKFDTKLIKKYSDKSEIIFHDASFFPNPVHASVQELKTLNSEVKKKIYLMHYGDDWKNYDASDFGGLVKQGYRYIFE